MNLYDTVANSIRYGVMGSIIIIILGLVIDDMGYGDIGIWLGVLMLIITPLFGIVVSIICLVLEKDRHWTKIAIILLAVVTVGIIISILI